LVISQHRDEYFRVELNGFDLSASAEIWAYIDANELHRFFQDLGGLDTPWQGPRSWVSIEQDFSLSATCTTLGSVTFQIELCGSQGEPEEWRVQAGLATEFGQLEQIAKNAAAFFNASNTCKV